MHRFGVLLLTVFCATTGWLRGAGIRPRQLLLDGVRVQGDRVVVVGERGGIFSTADNGQTWDTASSLTTATLTGVTFAPNSSNGWAVGHDALILSSVDAGRTWQKQWQGDNIQDSFLDVMALDTRRVIAVGAYGLCQVTDDGGKTWVKKKVIDEDYHLNRLSQGPTGTLYLAGEHGTLLRSTNRGDTWTKLRAPYDGSFYGVLALDARMIVAHGLRGRVFRSADDGATWVPIETEEPVLLTAAVRLKGNLLLLAGHPRVTLLSRDYGKNFTAWNSMLTTAVAELIELPDGNVLALGEAGATVLPAPQ